MRVPGHTPLRLQQLQSAYGLFHPRPSKLPQCPQIFIPIGVPQAHGHSLAVTAPLLSRARQQAVFGPRARLSIKWKKLAGTRHLCCASAGVIDSGMSPVAESCLAW